MSLKFCIDWSGEQDRVYPPFDIYPIRQFYIHPDIFDWFANLLTSYDCLKYEFMEIGHHPTDFPGIYVEIENDDSSSLEELDKFVKLADCKLIWESRPKYFLPIGTLFEKAQVELKSKLEQINVWKYIDIIWEFECNWFLYKKVQIFEFSNDISENQSEAIYNIFKSLDNLPKERAPLFISNPMLWHAASYSYIEVDTLAIDICAEEWRHNNLLADLDLYDILSIDLANKDFRDSYYNDYLDRYLQILVETIHPHLMNDGKKIDYWVTTNHDKTVIGYFFYRYHSRIAKVSIKVAYEDELRKLVKYYGIYAGATPYSNINLKNGKPNPKEIFENSQSCLRVCYNISNYHYFNDHLFRQMVEMPNSVQKFVFDLNEDFHFVCMQAVKPIKNFKKPIEIVILKCVERNKLQFENFIKYLIKLFQNYSHDLLYLCFFECTPTIDYLCFENLGQSLTRSLFYGMTITHTQLKVLAACLTEKCILTFNSCSGLNDASLFEFLKLTKLLPNKLVVNGNEMCTILLYFELAEYLMKWDENRICSVNRMPEINDLRWQLDKLEFFRSPKMIQLRDKFTKRPVDWYFYLNNIKDEPLIFD